MSPTRARAAHLGPERRRPLVLDAAFELFRQRGYSGTSMEAIAQAAGVTKPVVYDCFASKQELFAELLRREEARVLEQIAAVLPADTDLDDPERTLAKGFTAFLTAVAERPDAYRVIFLGEGGVDAGVARRIRRGRDQQVEAVAALAEHWLRVRSGGSDPEPQVAQLVAQTVVGLAETGARVLLEQPEEWTPESLGQTLGRLAARGQTALASVPS